MVTSYSAPSCTFLKGYYSCQVLMISLLYFQKYNWFCHPSSGVTTGEVINLLIYVTQKLKYFRKEKGYFKRKASLFVVSKSRSCKLQLFYLMGTGLKKIMSSWWWHWHSKWLEPRINILHWNLMVQVKRVVRRTNGSYWHFNIISGAHLQSQVTLTMIPRRMVKRQSLPTVLLRCPFTCTFQIPLRSSVIVFCWW